MDEKFVIFKKSKIDCLLNFINETKKELDDLTEYNIPTDVYLGISRAFISLCTIEKILGGDES